MLAALACGDSTGPSPAAPVIIFGRLLDGQLDIYRVSLDGADLVRLTTDLGDDREPTVAGETVVFTSYRTGNADLYSIPLAGGVERRLTNTSVNETSPALPRAGAKLAFTNDVSGVTRLWTSSIDGSGAAPAAPAFGNSGTIDATPAWSPNGDQLVFVSTSTNGQASLYLLVVATGAVTALPVGATPNVEPAWSPDGRSIAFASGRNTGSGVYRLDIASGVATLLVPGNVGQPVWLPDGRLVYTAFSATGSRLFWIDPAAPASLHEIDTGAGSASHAASP